MTFFHDFGRHAQRKKPQSIMNTTQKIVGCPLHSLEELRCSRCSRKVQNIINESSHPGLLPSGRQTVQISENKDKQIQKQLLPNCNNHT
ncbi:hypothetical protein ABVT39_019315 [Epinephelus coioides]